MRISLSAAMALLLLLLTPVANAVAPPSFAFKDYRHSELWYDIYVGRFEHVFEAESDALGDQLKASNNTKRLRMAVYRYHQQWSIVCSAKSREPLAPPITITETFVSDHEAPRQLDQRTYRIRERYVALWKGIFHELNTPQAGLQTLFGGGVDDTDFARLFADTGCGSELVAQFEDNLHRIYAGKSSRQSESSGPARAPLFFHGCNAVIAEMKIQKDHGTACACAYDVFLRDIPLANLWELEDDFTRERFVVYSASKVGMSKKMAGCLK